MRRLLNAVFDTRFYPDPIQRNQAMMATAIAIAMLVIYTLNALLVPDLEGFTVFQAVLEYGSFTETTFLILTLYLLAITGIATLRRGMLSVGSWLIIAAWYAGGIAPWLYSTEAITILGAPLLLLILLASLLQQGRGIQITLAVVLLTLAVLFVLRGSPSDQAATYVTVTVFQLSGALVLALSLRFFNLSITRGVTEAVEERAKGSDIIAQLTQLVAQRASSETLISAAATSINEAFPYIGRVRLYLIDDSGVESQLVADTGKDFTVTQTQIIRASVGGLSTIGQVTSYGKAVVTPLEGGKLIEAVLPLRIGSRILGALDLLSDNPRAFERPDVMDALQSLADGMALAIDNVRQFERAESRNRDNQKLVEELRTTLRDRDRLTQRLIGSVWSHYIRSTRDTIGLEVDFEAEDVYQTETLTPTQAEAIRINHFVQEERGDHQVLTMPLRYRGQVIGAMEFELDADRPFTPEDLELIQEVSERFGLAAENTRLVRNTQRQAQREALVNNIGARLQTTNNVQGTLAEAARGLSEAFKAQRVVIRLNSDADATGSKTEGRK